MPTDKEVALLGASSLALLSLNPLARTSRALLKDVFLESANRLSSVSSSHLPTETARLVLKLFDAASERVKGECTDADLAVLRVARCILCLLAEDTRESERTWAEMRGEERAFLKLWLDCPSHELSPTVAAFAFEHADVPLLPPRSRTPQEQSLWVIQAVEHISEARLVEWIGSQEHYWDQFFRLRGLLFVRDAEVTKRFSSLTPFKQSFLKLVTLNSYLDVDQSSLSDLAAVTESIDARVDGKNRWRWVGVVNLALNQVFTRLARTKYVQLPDEAKALQVFANRGRPIWAYFMESPSAARGLAERTLKSIHALMRAVRQGKFPESAEELEAIEAPEMYLLLTKLGGCDHSFPLVLSRLAESIGMSWCDSATLSIATKRGFKGGLDAVYRSLGEDWSGVSPSGRGLLLAYLAGNHSPSASSAVDAALKGLSTREAAEVVETIMALRGLGMHSSSGNAEGDRLLEIAVQTALRAHALGHNVPLIDPATYNAPCSASKAVLSIKHGLRLYLYGSIALEKDEQDYKDEVLQALHDNIPDPFGEHSSEPLPYNVGRNAAAILRHVEKGVLPVNRLPPKWQALLLATTWMPDSEAVKALSELSQTLNPTGPEMQVASRMIAVRTTRSPHSFNGGRGIKFWRDVHHCIPLIRSVMTAYGFSGDEFLDLLRGICGLDGRIKLIGATDGERVVSLALGELDAGELGGSEEAQRLAFALQESSESIRRGALPVQHKVVLPLPIAPQRRDVAAEPIVS